MAIRITFKTGYLLPALHDLRSTGSHPTSANARRNKSSQQMQAYENRSNSMDKIARQRSDFILDQERYIDPAYQSQGWINGLGETIYSPTNSYNPNLDRGLNNLNYEKLLKKE